MKLYRVVVNLVGWALLVLVAAAIGLMAIAGIVAAWRFIML